MLALTLAKPARHSLALSLLLCSACGYGPVTNDELAGDWQAFWGEGTTSLHLNFGEGGVSGTGTTQGEDIYGIQQFTVSTPGLDRLRWTWPSGEVDDFAWSVVPGCAGDPRPSPGQVRTIYLSQLSGSLNGQPQNPQLFAVYFFSRTGLPAVSCAGATGPP